MGIWHKSAAVAYLAVFAGVCGHASSEFVSVLSGVGGPELSVWRFLLGGFGLVMLALIFPASRNLLEPFREHGLRRRWHQQYRHRWRQPRRASDRPDARRDDATG